MLEPAFDDADISRFTTVPLAYSLDGAEAWIARQQQRIDDGTAVVLAIELPDRPGPVGMIGVFGLDEPQPEARIGYWVIRAFRGRGLARDAARRLTTWAFDELGLEALHLDIEPQNAASRRVAQHLGARPNGMLCVTDAGRDVTLNRYTIVAGAHAQP
jgi:ribosomal-protein-alanine N-acetyltransferase